MAIINILPGLTFSVDANSADQAFRDMTKLFGLSVPYNAFNDPNAGFSLSVIRAGSQPYGGFCARSGNYFPADHLVRDGQGRVVGDAFYTEGPIVPELPPFPLFGKGNEF
jgi:hypothetical protein